MNFDGRFAVDVTDKATMKLEESVRKEMDRWLQRHKGQRVELALCEIKATRTSQANRYYWGVVVHIIAEHLGYQKDELHEALKQKFLRLDAEPDEHGLVRVKSTSTMSVKEFMDFTENVVTWAGAEFGLNIPAPGEMAA